MYRRIAELDENLQSFANAVGQLGSSAALWRAAHDFRRLLGDFLRLFRMNASKLFGDIDQDPINVAEHKDSSIFRGGQHHFCISLSDPKPAHDCFAFLADGLKIFLSCLNRFPEFTDEVVNTSVELFHRDLKYWEFCLKEHKGQSLNCIWFVVPTFACSEQYHTPPIRLYLNEMSGEVVEHLENISQAVATFVSNGMYQVF